MQEPDLETSIAAANACGVKLDEMIADLNMKTDEEKVVFWSLFRGYSVSVIVQQAGMPTALTILNSLAKAVQQDEIKSNFH